MLNIPWIKIFLFRKNMNGNVQSSFIMHKFYSMLFPINFNFTKIKSNQILENMTVWIFLFIEVSIFG